MHAKVALLAQQARDVAVGIVDVAEVERIGDTGIDAGGRGVRIDPGDQAVGKPEIDAIRAEGALLRDPQSARVFALDLVTHRRRTIGETRGVDLEPRLIGTRHVAIGAADADIVVDGDDTVGSTARCGRWTDVHAGRIVAVLATDRHEGSADVRIATGFDVEHLAPLHRGRRGIRVPAGRGP